MPVKFSYVFIFHSTWTWNACECLMRVYFWCMCSTPCAYRKQIQKTFLKTGFVWLNSVPWRVQITIMKRFHYLNYVNKNKNTLNKYKYFKVINNFFSLNTYFAPINKVLHSQTILKKLSFKKWRYANIFWTPIIF